MRNDPLYTQTPFDRKDYQSLYKYAPPLTGLKRLIHTGRYRDKRIQRMLSPRCVKILHLPLEDMPLYINDRDPIARTLASWRLSINK